MSEFLCLMSPSIIRRNHRQCLLLECTENNIHYYSLSLSLQYYELCTNAAITTIMKSLIF
jgi:hypothetical protein